MFGRLFRSSGIKQRPLTEAQVAAIMDAVALNMERCPFMGHILTLCGPFGKGFPTPKRGYLYWLYHVVRCRVQNAIADSTTREACQKVLDNQIQDDLTDMQCDLDYFSEYDEMSRACMREDRKPGWVYWQGKLTWSSVLYGELSLMPDERHKDWFTYFSGVEGPLAMRIPTDAAVLVCKVVEKHL